MFFCKKYKNINHKKMEILQNLLALELFTPIIFILITWETIWKSIAMWKAGRNNHLVWFICIAFINTIGILPIIYILIQRKKLNLRT